MAQQGGRTSSGSGSVYTPGAYKSLTASEAMKSAESLLEQKTIAEIREVRQGYGDPAAWDPASRGECVWNVSAETARRGRRLWGSLRPTCSE